MDLQQLTRFIEESGKQTERIIVNVSHKIYVKSICIGGVFTCDASILFVFICAIIATY